MQQQDHFDLRDRSRSPRAQFIPSHNGQDATNPASKVSQLIQIQTNTSAFESQYQCTPHTEYNPLSYMPLSQTNEYNLFDHKTNRYPSFRNKIYGNTSAKTKEKESRISVKMLISDANLSPIKRIGLTKVNQLSTPAWTMYGYAVQTISPIPDHLNMSMASGPSVLPERYDKQDILEPYSLVKS